MRRLTRGGPWLALLGIAAASLTCTRGGSARGYNLLLVTLDTVRADHLGPYGYAAAETPNLDRLAREGVRFASASSTVPLTLPAHATILSGLLPLQHGLHNNGAGRFPETLPTLATDLKASGYRAGAFVAAFVLDRRFGLERGFDRYDDEIERDPDSPGGLMAERPGAVVVDRALAWLAEAPSPDPPFFLWVHLYDAHAPYDPPEPFRSRHAGRPYDGEIASVDAQVGRLLQALEARGAAGRTLVAVMADHGEALGEHGEPTHGLLVYEATLRVPLLLRAPGVLASGKTVGAPVSLADVAPTLAGLLAVPFADTPAAPRGRDLSAALRSGGEPPPPELYAESEYPRTFGWAALASVRRGSLKLIAAPRPELYDLANDPGEQKNLAERDPRRRDLEAHLEELRRGARAAAAAPASMDQEARERLASLGYVAATQAPPGSQQASRDPKDATVLFRGFEEANAALLAGRLDDAVARLEPLVAADPHNPVFRGALAQAHRRRGDDRKAVAAYRQAVADAPGDGDGWYNLAVTLQESGQTREALQAIDEAVRLDPDRAEAHNARGIALLGVGKPEEAMVAFDRASALDPRDARPQNNRGNVLRQLGRLDEAEQAYRRAAALSRRYADPLNGLGALEVERDRPAQALPYFDAALALAPGSREIQLNRGIALEMMGNIDAAAAAYRAVLQGAHGDRDADRQRQIAAQLVARLEARRGRSASKGHS
jgi:arylsulfatase A-like enzyme/Flp pilus assembly protein TadD